MTLSESGPVRWYLENDIGIISVNNPPVNALSQAVRQGILECLQALNQTQCRAIVLHCEGRTFFAGADIREFNQPPKEPHLPDVVRHIYQNPKPIVAAIHGTTLGGGLEVAMTCHHRIALKNTRIGLPEVNLGLIPGAAGTQLLPDLVGTHEAINLITSGKHASINDFKDTDIIQSIITENDTEKLLIYCINYASRLTHIKHFKSPEPKNLDWTQLKSDVTQKARGRQAPIKAFQVIEQTRSKSLDEGMVIERQAFLELKASAQSIALRHAFAAEKRAVKFETESEPLTINTIGVVGGGTMGTGIATTCLNAGYQVVLSEQNQEQADKARQTVMVNLEKARQRGLLTDAAYAQQSSSFTVTAKLSSLTNADLVIEAIFEDLQLKIELFKSLETICVDDCLFATNTSYLDLNKMAEVLQDKSRLIGIHFFSPAHIMKLVEVVRTDYVSEQVIASAFALARKARKMPVLVGNCFGFAGNRMYTRYGREIQQMLLEGATVNDIDTAMKEFGMAMGPLEVQDLAGIDVGHRARSAQPFPAHDPGYFRVSAMLVKQGYYGRKTGRGFYNYDHGQQQPNAALDEQLVELAKSLNISPTYPDKETIKQRALLALISEGYQLFEEGIIQQLSDLDVIWMNGYGFPRHLGGPMHMAEQMGAVQLQEQINTLQQQYGHKLWPTITPKTQ